MTALRYGTRSLRHVQLVGLLLLLLPFPGSLRSQNGCCSGYQPVGCECGLYCAGPGAKWECASCSPIILDVAGNGYSLTDAANGVLFDLPGKGIKKKISWTSLGSDDGFLVFDRNGNGLIDNGVEMFGSFTPQPVSPAPNGFLGLAMLDKIEAGGNNDGLIDALDAAYSILRVWVDKNHDGISQPEELLSLSTLNLHSLNLDYQTHKFTDEYGNQFRYRAKIRGSNPPNSGKWAYDIILISAGN